MCLRNVPFHHSSSVELINTKTVYGKSVGTALLDLGEKMHFCVCMCVIQLNWPFKCSDIKKQQVFSSVVLW